MNLMFNENSDMQADLTLMLAIYSKMCPENMWTLISPSFTYISWNVGILWTQITI